MPQINFQKVRKYHKNLENLEKSRVYQEKIWNLKICYIEHMYEQTMLLNWLAGYC